MTSLGDAGLVPVRQGSDVTDGAGAVWPDRRVRDGALAVLLSAALAGCAGSTAVPTAPTPSGAGPITPVATSPPPSSPSPAPEWDASGASFGVDRMAWPGTVQDARTVLEDMPKQLGGAPGEVTYSPGDADDSGANASIAYGEFGSVAVSEEYVSSDTEDGEPELLSANNLLAASFGLVYGCARGSYRGTAPKPAYPGGGPGVTDRPLKGSVWFSCRIDAAEGDDDFTGFAVGWTNKRTAWLVVAEDESATRQLVTALHEAAT